ncbi:MAG: hypothetical protein AAGL96_07200 [Pseudomonadota bacterium]
MDGYSRLIAWLKVLLPLTALALLSTLFLFSRDTDPVAAIPFAEGEVTRRIEGEQITGPFFSGATKGGDRVMVEAGTLRTGQNMTSDVTELSAQIDMVSGTRMVLKSDRGQFDMTRSTSELAGNVVITTSTGIEMNTDSLTADLDEMTLATPEITATGPMGRLSSGQMRMEQRGDANDTHFIFTDGVKLVYDPKSSEE